MSGDEEKSVYPAIDPKDIAIEKEDYLALRGYLEGFLDRRETDKFHTLSKATQDYHTKNFSGKSKSLFGIKKKDDDLYAFNFERIIQASLHKTPKTTNYKYTYKCGLLGRCTSCGNIEAFKTVLNIINKYKYDINYYEFKNQNQSTYDIVSPFALACFTLSSTIGKDIKFEMSKLLIDNGAKIRNRRDSAQGLVAREGVIKYAIQDNDNVELCKIIANAHTNKNNKIKYD